LTHRRVPSSLSDALDALEADQDLVDAVGAELVAQHLAVKRAEWSVHERHDGLEMREYSVPLAPGHANGSFFVPLMKFDRKRSLAPAASMLDQALAISSNMTRSSSRARCAPRHNGAVETKATWSLANDP